MYHHILCEPDPIVHNQFYCTTTTKQTVEYHLQNMYFVFMMGFMLYVSVFSSLFFVSHTTNKIHKYFDNVNQFDNFKYEHEDMMRFNPPFRYKYIDDKLVDIIRKENNTENKTENNTENKTENNTENKPEHKEAKYFVYTPIGNILIKYDYDNKCFNYWSKSTANRYILETVARKYVQLTQQYELYTIPDYIKKYVQYYIFDIENGVERDVRKYLEQEKEYNKTNKDKKNTRTQNKNENIETNTFVHLGPITDINLTQTETYSKKTEPISYSDYIKFWKTKQ